MTATILARGETLGGYKIEDIIGVGGMAIVYRAEQLSLGRQVALKVMAPQLSANPGFRERFRREGKHIAGLDHPNVVTVFDSGEVDGRLFLAMRLVDGTTLADRMQDEGVSADETVSLLAPIAGALDSAHGLGLVHRDVKPQNILITEAGHPYLADFGVAKAPSSTAGLTNTGAFVGSVNYASPEQIRGERITAAGDIYALTAVLYQCLTGQVPFPRDTDAGVMHAHLNDAPPKLPVQSTPSDELDLIIQRGMAKDVADRYASATDVTTDAATIIGALEPQQRRVRPAFSVVFAGPALDAALAADDTEDVPRAQTEEASLAPAPVAVLEAPGEPVALVEPAEEPVLAAVGTEIIEPEPGLAAPAARLTTSADVRREPPAPEVAPRREARSGNRRTLIIAGGGDVAAACIGGAIVALSGGSSAPVKRTLSNGPVTLAYASPWRPAAATLGVTAPFARATVIANASASMTVGTFKRSAPVPAGLPAALRGSLGSPSASATVTLDGVMARSYSWSSAGSDVAAIIVGQKTQDVGLLCKAISSAQLASCVRATQAASLTGSTTLAPGAPGAVTRALTAAIAPVRLARADVSKMGHTKLAGRAKITSRLASVDGHAAAVVSHIPVLARNAALATSLEAALHHESRLLSELSRDAGANKRGSYSGLRKPLATASQRLASALHAFRVAGMHLPVPALLSIPVAPALPKPVSHAASAVSSIASTNDTSASDQSTDSAPAVSNYSTPAESSPPAASEPSQSSSAPATHASTPTSSKPASSLPSHKGLPSTINLGG